MNLDVQTLFIANLSTSFIVAILMIVIWRTQEYCSSLGWISLSFICLISSDLLISFDDYFPSFISAVIANTIYLLWIIFLWQGVRDFQGLAFPLKSVVLSLAVFIILFSYYRYIKFDANMQIVVFSGFVLVYSILTMAVLLKPIHSKWPATEYKFTLCIVLSFAVVTLLRISNAVIDKISHEWINRDVIQQISILSYGLYSVAFALGFLWILQRHLAKQIKMREEALKAAYLLTDKLREEAERAALHDPLTLAGNRRKFIINADMERNVIFVINIHCA
ncbi:hypothetical protein [Psychromonas sp. MME2]|uniref:hypothetical protein n=1 Tax=Psychromonas sp. MME2 TaxID=3231033 RepID=UPI00339C5E11